MLDLGLTGRVAMVTGANQGIGAATARMLAAHGVGVFLTYLRLDAGEHAGDNGYPVAYGQARARSAEDIVHQIRDAGDAAFCGRSTLSVMTGSSLSMPGRRRC